MTRRFLLVPAVLSCAALTGCLEGDAFQTNIFADNSTTGDEGKLSFEYRDWFQTWPLDARVMTGSSVLLDIDGLPDDQDVAASSSAPDVATFTLERSCTCSTDDGHGISGHSVPVSQPCNAGEHRACSTTSRVNAHAAGSAQIVVKRADGELVDRATVFVSDAASGVFRVYDQSARDGYVTVTKLAARPNQELSLDVNWFDSSKHALLVGSGVVDWSSDDPGIASAEAWLGTPSVTAGLPGNTTVHAAAPGVTLDLPVEVRK